MVKVDGAVGNNVVVRCVLSDVLGLLKERVDFFL